MEEGDKTLADKLRRGSPLLQPDSRGEIMADTGDQYVPNAYPGVVHFGGDRNHRHGLEGKDAAFIEGLHDAGRDLAAANASGIRDLDNANSDATRDVLDANRDLMGALHHGGRDRDFAEQIGRVERVVVEQAKDNVIATGHALKENVQHILDQGSRGRETTLEAKSDLMKEHCETQRLVIEKACEVKEAVHQEANTTRELIRDEHRALLQRELDAIKQENTLLKLQVSVGGGGIGTARA